MRKQNDAASRVIIFSLALVFVLVLIANGMMFQSARRVHRANDRVEHTFQSKHELDEILIALDAIELSVLSYLVTGAPEDRRVVSAGYARYELHAAEALRLTMDNPAQQENLAHLDERYRRWVEAHDRLIAKPGGTDAYTAYVGESSAPMQWFRNHIRRMEDVELNLLEEHLSRLELKEQSSTQVVIWRTSLIAVLILGLGFWAVKRVRDFQEEIHQLAEEKEMLLKEVQHRVKNTMDTMVSMLWLQVWSTEEPEAAEALSDAACRFRSMAALYDQLYRTEEHGSGSVQEYLGRVLDGLAQLFPAEPVVNLSREIEDFPMDTKPLSTLGLIVNELVTNAMKYAFRVRGSGRLAVSLAQRDGRVILTVVDDGPGMPDSCNLANPSGFGLTMVKALVTQLAGTFRLEAGSLSGAPGARAPGACAVVEFPV